MMNRPIASLAVIGLAAAAVLAASPARADVNHRLDEAWKAALIDQHGVLTEKQHALINAVAYGAAAALLCDGIDIDPDKVAKATTSVLADGPKGLSEEEEFSRFTDIMLTLGTAKGILLSEGALNKASFCANAEAEKATSPADTFWK